MTVHRGARRRVGAKQTEASGGITVVIPAWGARYLACLPRAVASARAAAADARVLVVSPEPRLDPGLEAELVEIRPGSTVGAARNLGLAQVATDLVCFLDVDDALRPGSLGRLREALRSSSTAIAATGRVIEQPGGRRVAPPVLSRPLAGAPRLLSFANALWHILPTQGATLMRTAAASGAGGYSDDDGGEDWAFSIGLLRYGQVILCDLDVLDYAPSRGRPAGGVGAHELRRRSGIARARRRSRRSGPVPWLESALLHALHLVLIEVLRPLVRARRRRRRAAT